jgi:hypothetical protein
VFSVISPTLRDGRDAIRPIFPVALRSTVCTPVRAVVAFLDDWELRVLTSRALTPDVVLGVTRDVARFAVADPRGTARDGCATGVFVVPLLIGVMSANAGKTNNPLNTTINLFIVNPFIPYALFYHIVNYVTSEKTRIIHYLGMIS